MISATDVDPSPGAPHANGAAYRRLSTQVKTPRIATAIVPIAHTVAMSAETQRSMQSQGEDGVVPAEPMKLSTNSATRSG